MCEQVLHRLLAAGSLPVSRGLEPAARRAAEEATLATAVLLLQVGLHPIVHSIVHLKVHPIVRAMVRCIVYGQVESVQCGSALR